MYLLSVNSRVIISKCIALELEDHMCQRNKICLNITNYNKRIKDHIAKLIKQQGQIFLIKNASGIPIKKGLSGLDGHLSSKPFNWHARESHICILSLNPNLRFLWLFPPHLIFDIWRKKTTFLMKIGEGDSFIMQRTCIQLISTSIQCREN